LEYGRIEVKLNLLRGDSARVALGEYVDIATAVAELRLPLLRRQFDYGSELLAAFGEYRAYETLSGKPRATPSSL
jgi:hypothetical protein